MDKCTPESLLEGKKIKLTRQRQVVLDTIISSGRPFCAAELHEELNEKMDLATIYRNLDIFSSEGIIRQVMNENERQYYELACRHNPEHPHFYCNRCGKIYCMKQGRPLRVKADLDEDFIVEQTVVQFRGICPDCRKK
ncbi:MAG TPA: transcriptional repressor [Spirochaetota bacterium]|nr:transcriptional repressor [Spirochaetota bacterium]HPJ34286.1 transcriptional repressor [Spirochaetota bacterium]